MLCKARFSRSSMDYLFFLWALVYLSKLALFLSTWLLASCVWIPLMAVFLIQGYALDTNFLYPGSPSPFTVQSRRHVVVILVQSLEALKSLNRVDVAGRFDALPLVSK